MVSILLEISKFPNSKCVINSNPALQILECPQNCLALFLKAGVGHPSYDSRKTVLNTSKSNYQSESYLEINVYVLCICNTTVFFQLNIGHWLINVMSTSRSLITIIHEHINYSILIGIFAKKVNLSCFRLIFPRLYVYTYRFLIKYRDPTFIVTLRLIGRRQYDM